MLTNFRVLLYNMLRGLHKKALQQILYFSENQHDIPAIFFVSNSYIPLGTAAPRNNKFPRAQAGVVKTAWYSDVRYKQRAATEFLVAAKQLVTNIHKRLCGDSAVDNTS
jgi:hypothetical protein